MEKRDGRTENRVNRYKVEDGEPLCFCSAHNDFLPCSEFNKSTGYQHGFDYRCRACYKLNKLSVNGHQGKQRKEERTLLNAFYRSAGYDPESPVPIHHQFLIRHDL